MAKTSLTEDQSCREEMLCLEEARIASYERTARGPVTRFMRIKDHRSAASARRNPSDSLESSKQPSVKQTSRHRFRATNSGFIMLEYWHWNDLDLRLKDPEEGTAELKGGSQSVPQSYQSESCLPYQLDGSELNGTQPSVYHLITHLIAETRTSVIRRH